MNGEHFFVAHSIRALARIDMLVSCVLSPAQLGWSAASTLQLVAAETHLSVLADTVTAMRNPAPCATTAGNKLRERARATENPTTKSSPKDEPR